MKLNFDLEDLTNAALKRMVKQLLLASDSDEAALVRKATKPAKNELADLDEEMHGKPNTPQVEDDDSGFDLSVDAEGDDSDAGDSETDAGPKKKGKK